MQVHKKDLFIQVLSIAVLVLILPLLLTSANKNQKIKTVEGVMQIPTPTPFNPFPYNIPEIPRSKSYRIMLVGDSIVGALGPNAQLLRQHLIEYYPNNEFVNYNYGFGATSIETLPERLNSDTVYLDQNFPSILTQGFDLIIVESFAYNPLSQNLANEGLTRYIQILDKSMKQIIKTKPESVVVLMTPIAPSRTFFAQGVYDLSSDEREKWANERIAYINAVINYSNENNIPLINIFEKSLTSDGEVNLDYINHDDYIHPSAEGIDLISKTIAEYIYTNSIFPQ